jgi:hypothetical protein
LLSHAKTKEEEENKTVTPFTRAQIARSCVPLFSAYDNHLGEPRNDQPISLFSLTNLLSLSLLFFKAQKNLKIPRQNNNNNKVSE